MPDPPTTLSQQLPLFKAALLRQTALPMTRSLNCLVATSRQRRFKVIINRNAGLSPKRSTSSGSDVRYHSKLVTARDDRLVAAANKFRGAGFSIPTRAPLQPTNSRFIDGSSSSVATAIKSSHGRSPVMNTAPSVVNRLRMRPSSERSRVSALPHRQETVDRSPARAATRTAGGIVDHAATCSLRRGFADARPWFRLGEGGKMMECGALAAVRCAPPGSRDCVSNAPSR